MRKKELMKCKEILDAFRIPLTGIERNRLMYELREIIDNAVTRIEVKEVTKTSSPKFLPKHPRPGSMNLN